MGSTITSLTLGTTILANDHSKYAVTGTYNLTIVNVQTSDEGIYQCTVGATTREASLQTVGKFFTFNVSMIHMSYSGKTNFLYIFIFSDGLN